MRIIVDDLRSFVESQETDVVCRDVTQGQLALFTAAQLEKVIDELWLDHDLGKACFAGDTTIMPLVTWLEENRDELLNYVRRVYVHTSNAGAARKMVTALDGAGYHASYRNGDWEGVLTYDPGRV